MHGSVLEITRMRAPVAVVVVLFVFAGLGYVGWRMLETRGETSCEVCGRPLHSESAVWADAAGERRHFCCAACALRAERQSGDDIEITEVSDHASDAVLDASEAIFVVGSNVNYCLRQHSVFDPQRNVLDDAKTAGALEFDRCSPSILAFSSRSAAAQFAERQGGRLLTLEQLPRALP